MVLVVQSQRYKSNTQARKSRIKRSGNSSWDELRPASREGKRRAFKDLSQHLLAIHRHQHDRGPQV